LVFPGWVDGIDEKILNFLSTLEKDDQPGRYLPCQRGVTPEGEKVALGPSCFALKIYHMLGEWMTIDERRRVEWVEFIKSFQNGGESLPLDSIKRNAFIDPVLINNLEAENSRISVRTFIKKILSLQQSKEFLNSAERAVIAETKQALATLAEVGESSPEPYDWFPKTPKAVSDYMGKFDWTKPWGAGGQTAALPVFFSLEASRSMPASEVNGLQETASAFFKSIVDDETGGYFTGSPPDHGMLINGAMKVLTALSWLEEPIHYPEKLIDTTLRYLPRADGCHLVDAVYVLSRCASQTEYGRERILEYCMSVLDMIRSHHNHDGGFSYSIGAAQTTYYGLPISRGLNESDIHGTILLTWTLAMIFNLCDYPNQWKNIKP